MFLPILDLNLNLQGRTFIRADGSNGSDNPRRGRNRPYQTIQAVADNATSGAAVVATGGRFTEEVTLARSGASKVVFVGSGGRGSSYIEPSGTNASGLTVHADDVTLYNLGVAGKGTGTALTVTGARFRAYGCKFEGGTNQLVIGPGTDAQITAGTRGKGADFLFEDCEFCWGANGIVLTASDYGAVTQGVFKNCRFHNLTTSSAEETGGSAAVRFQNIQFIDCVFDGADDGTMPTKFLSLNDDNANSGLVTGCRFPVALNSGKNLVSTKMIWAGNFHPAGLSTTQPS